MNTAIQARYQWTLEELTRATDYHWRLVLRRPVRWTIHLLALCILILSIVSVTAIGVSWRALLLGLAALFWFFLRRPVNHWYYRRHFSKRPDRDAWVECAITDTDVRTLISGLADARIGWAFIIRWVVTPHGFLFYLSGSQPQWIPYSGFMLGDDVKRVAELAKSKVPKFHQVA